MSTQVEQRLRQELRNLADQVGTADVRPLRQPRRRSSAAWLGPVAAMAAIALVTGGLMVARNSLHAHASAASGLVAPPDPAVIAVAGSPTSGDQKTIKLVSVRDGSVSLALRLADNAADTGVALAPDGGSVYLGTQGMRLTALSLTTGRSAVIGTGQSPSVSPDSKHVAYVTGRALTKVAVEDVATGRTRTINLTGVIGQHSFLQSPDAVAWLGDGSQVVAVPQPAYSPLVSYHYSHGERASTGSAEWVNDCGQQNSPLGVCVVVINVGRVLSARAVFIRGLPPKQGYQLFGADLTASRVFFVAASTKGFKSHVITRVTLSRGKAEAHRFLSLRFHGIAVAVAPDGDRVIYASPTRRPAVWVGTVSRGRIVSRYQLASAWFGFNQVGW